MIKNLLKFWRYILSLPRMYSIGGALVVLVALVVGVHAATRSPAVADAPAQISHVQIASVSSLSGQAGPLPLTGKVTSESDASILAETSGEVTSLNVAIGDSVSAGDVIAEFENSSQRAAVLQAQGALDAAQASLQKISGTGASNSSISLSSANQAAANAASAASVAQQSAYTSLDDAVHTKADTLFSNPDSPTPSLNLSIPDSQLILTIENQRSQLSGVLADISSLSSEAGTSTDIDTSIQRAIADEQIVLTFLNNLVQAVNQANPSQNISAATLSQYQASIGAARSEVVGSISSLTSIKSQYDSAVSGTLTAANSAGAGSQSDIAGAQAQVKQAQGAYNAAVANLEKTIVRSPISGVVVSLPINQGDFVSSFAPVAQVSNPSALEVLTYVTSDDAKTLAVGGAATIEGSTPGIIVSIAPALDPTTGKIQVKIGLPGSTASLTDGETISLSLARAKQSASQTATNASSTILIPIISVKITPQGPVVFTVDTTSSTSTATTSPATTTVMGTLVPHAITLGDILGDQVKVTAGITNDMDIVTDARGLSQGQSVVVDSQ